MKRLLLYCVTILVVMTLTGCAYMMRDMMRAKSLAEPKIDSIHKLFNEEKYSEIYYESDPGFQKVTTEQQLEKLLSSIHRKLGSVKSTSNENWNVSTFNLTTRIVMIQNTIFEQGTGTEKFTFVITDSDALLLGYNINSNDLIEK